MRLNHMELTLAPGTLTDEYRADIDAFYCEVLGWTSSRPELFGQAGHYLRIDNGQFILLMESDKPISSPGYDHSGLLVDTRADVDAVLADCEALAADDDRMQLKYYDDLKTPNVVVHAFYFKYLLPIWFDVQVLEWQPDKTPSPNWAYTA